MGMAGQLLNVGRQDNRASGNLEALERSVVEETDVVRHGANQYRRAVRLALLRTQRCQGNDFEKKNTASSEVEMTKPCNAREKAAKCQSHMADGLRHLHEVLDLAKRDRALVGPALAQALEDRLIELRIRAAGQELVQLHRPRVKQDDSTCSCVLATSRRRTFTKSLRYTFLLLGSLRSCFLTRPPALSSIAWCKATTWRANHGLACPVILRSAPLASSCFILGSAHSTNNRTARIWDT
jgi:hypothetical protein